MSDYDVIVIGAGCGGLSAGALLAGEGRRVLVLERSNRVGGCCSTFEKDGFKFDVGASIVEMTEPINWTFRTLGTTFEQEVDLIPCDPMMTSVLRDDSRITVPMSLEATRAVLSGISAEDGEGWDRYEAYYHELADVAFNTLFAEPAQGFGDVVRWIRKDPRLVRYLPTFLRSYEGSMARFFGPRFQEALAYQAFYFGASPELVPGLFALVSSSEHRGIFYPRGGMIQVPESLRRVGERFGMTLRLSAPVSRVMVRDRRVQGVRLADGTEITAPVVVSDVNAKLLYEKLIGLDHLPALARRGVQSYGYGLECAMVYLGLDAAPDLNSHHGILAAPAHEINAYWRQRTRNPIQDKPFGLIGWSTCHDPSTAPPGKHTLILTMGGYSYDGVDWDAAKPRLIDNVIDHMDRHVSPGLRDHVEVALATTPWDFDRHIGIHHGAIYGLDESLPSMAIFRPSHRSKSIKGLYLAGSSTSPGGGVPCVVASGRIAANLVSRFEH